jgi:hypothetical protein
MSYLCQKIISYVCSSHSTQGKGNGHSTIFSRYEKSITDLFTIVVEAKKGVNARAFFDMVSLSGIDRNKMADVMNVSLKTLLRYRSRTRSSMPTKSERVLKLIALYKKGKSSSAMPANSANGWISPPMASETWFLSS